jgi:hypothetical protein
MDLSRDMSNMLSLSGNPSCRAQEKCDTCEISQQNYSFCVRCDTKFCDECWAEQPAHRRQPLSANHERMDYTIVAELKKVLEPPESGGEIQKSMHDNDKHTAWFGVSPGNTHFWDSGRYNTIMAETLSERDRERYPQLVSFIGETGLNQLPIYLASINLFDF